ncbi:hypothetical protein NCAS_0F00850 [Naumovozyma castellii]|uniref:PHD-type domain-containing protein n=1 Tax=Naumovozyma castellii TaxID=27288 RepID=G0VGE9_NAUCA|nr:hypothetical protein NCAS_0F00850 [Naumovozyma castellii CBS 4309]CCC70569.1 hypothetical protein NCAS_0F00850 [Naumovozyma castellii CBS 4309]
MQTPYTNLNGNSNSSASDKKLNNGEYSSINESTNESPFMERASSSSLSNVSSSSASPVAVPPRRRGRPKRSTSRNVDYDLKKRKIISSEDNHKKKKRNNRTQSTSRTNTPSQSTTTLRYGADKQDNYDDNENTQPEIKKDILESDVNGKIIRFNEPIPANDVINPATGVSMGQGPSEKVKRTYLWNYKRSNTTPGLLIPSGSLKVIQNANVVSTNNDEDEKAVRETQMYDEQLQTRKSDSLTMPSTLRYTIRLNKNRPKDENSSNKDSKEILLSPSKTSHKIKATFSAESKSKLLGQNSLPNLPLDSGIKHEADEKQEQEGTIENDDYCSACFQTGSFLCCDTCPKSFHFLCLDPPLDPNNLPEGDWSCHECLFKMKYPNNTQLYKAERAFVKNLSMTKTKGNLFGKLLFQINGINPRQFNLPQSIKETFQDVKTGQRGQYLDNREKEPLPDKILYDAPYGQSVTKLDTYNPDIHIDSSNPDKYLICYKCRTTKMGTWDHPEKGRLIMRCDYCNTPWHLDCIPEVPRASLKNIGLKWKCPLHAVQTTKKRRRLTRNQEYIEPLQSCGFRNDGDIEIHLDELSSTHSKYVMEAFKKPGSIPAVPILKENSVKLDFLDKVFRIKKTQMEQSFKHQERLIETIVFNEKRQPAKSGDIIPLLYFQMCNSSGSESYMKKLWNLKELSKFAGDTLQKEMAPNGEEVKENSKDMINISSSELQKLLELKQLLESKPKEDVIEFFGLNNI